ncbi:MAG: tetratricopeptide repeat protein [Planctomycetaceae bacterium]|nr:tetratricopeptide repeat protein [Planctomycetaceae bacterium]
MLRRFLLLACLLGGLVKPVPMNAQDLHGQYFEALNQRGLYAVAEDYAMARLAEETLPPDQRAELTIELAKTLVAHGAVLRGSAQEEMWKQAAESLQEFLTHSDQSPRRREVEAALAALPVRMGLELAWQVDVTPEAKQVRQRAQELLESALPKLPEQVSQLRSAPDPTDQELADGASSHEELAALADEFETLQGQASLAIARLLEPGVERTAALVTAERDFAQLARSKPVASLVPEIQFLRAEVARLQGEDRKALGLVGSLLDEQDPTLRDRALAEKLRIQLSLGETDAAFQLVADRLRTGRPPHDELRAVAIEVLLASWTVARMNEDQALQTQLMEEAQRQQQLIQGRWAQWSGSLLARHQENQAYGPKLAAVVRDAQSAWNAGDATLAATRYGEASAQAKRLGQPDQAMELGMLRASILMQQQQWSDAAETLSELVEHFGNHARAAEADLLKCYSWGRLYSANATQSHRERFEQSLRNHLANHPGQPTIPDASWMLAAHEEQRLQWTNALPLYRAIPVEHSRFPDASLRIVVIYEKILNRLKEIEGPVGEWEEHAQAEIDRIIAELGRLPELTPVIGQTLLHAAQLILRTADPNYEQADRLLATLNDEIDRRRLAAERSQTSVNPVWLGLRTRLNQLRIVSLAGQERLAEARALMSGLQQTDATTLLEILSGLTELSDLVAADRRFELGRIQQMAVREIEQQRDQLTPRQQQLLDESSAQAYIAMGDLLQAAAIYEALIRKSPKDRSLIHRVIDVYLDHGEPADFEKAKDWWIRIEKLERPGTEKWIEARLHVATLLEMLGEKNEARKLLGVTKALYPQMGSPELLVESQRLEDRLAGN